MWRPHPFFRPSDLPSICGLPCIIRLRFCVTEETVCPNCTDHDACCAAIGSATSRCSDNTHHVSIIRRTLSLWLYVPHRQHGLCQVRTSVLAWGQEITWVSAMCLLLLSDFNQTGVFFLQICPEGVELLHADGRTYVWT